MLLLLFYTKVYTILPWDCRCSDRMVVGFTSTYAIIAYLTLWDICGRHRMVVGFTSTYVIIAYHYERCGIFVVFIVW